MDPESHHASTDSLDEPVLIKRYANRKLYNTRSSRYITLKGIAELIEQGSEVRVVDNESGEDITSVTLSQILVDTERNQRSVPGPILSDLIQRSGDALYAALKRGVGDASGSIEDLQRGVRRFLDEKLEDARGVQDAGREWVALAVPDLEKVLQSALERALDSLDLPRRSDVDRLHRKVDEMLERLETLDRSEKR